MHEIQWLTLTLKVLSGDIFVLEQRRYCQQQWAMLLNGPFVIALPVRLTGI